MTWDEVVAFLAQARKLGLEAVKIGLDTGLIVEPLASTVNVVAVDAIKHKADRLREIKAELGG